MNHPILIFFTIVTLMQGMISKMEKVQLFHTSQSSPTANTLASSVFSYLMFSQEKPNELNKDAFLTSNAGYYIPISIGEPPQTLNALIDTGSGQMFVTPYDCQTCQKFVRQNLYDSPQKFYTLYNEKKSQTFVNLNKNMTLNYIASQVNGYLGQDNVKIDNLYIKQKFLVVQSVKNYEFTLLTANLIGLSLSKRLPSFLDIAYNQQKIISPNFAIEINSRKLKQPSYFYYNISEGDFPGAEFKHTFRTQQWTVQLQQLRIDGEIYEVEEATIDSGSTFTILPNKVFRKIYNKYFKNACHQTKTQLNLTFCDCGQMQKFPTFTIKISQNISIELKPQHYFEDVEELGLYCVLFLFGSDLYQAVLGQNFMRHFIVIFNKQNNSIGFFKKQLQSIEKYFYSLAGQKIAQIITYTMGIMCMIQIFMMLKTKIQSKIRERLLQRNANMEMVIEQAHSQNHESMQKYEKQIINNMKQQRQQQIELDTII